MLKLMRNNRSPKLELIPIFLTNDQLGLALSLPSSLNKFQFLIFEDKMSGLQGI